AERRKTSFLQKRFRKLAYFRRIFTTRARPIHNVVIGCHPGKQRGLLKDDKSIDTRTGHRLFVDCDSAAPGAFKARDEADQGAVAAAGGANDDSQLAAFDSEGAAADDFLRESVGAVRLANVLDDDLAADRGREYGAGRIRSLRLNNIFRCHP